MNPSFNGNQIGAHDNKLPSSMSSYKMEIPSYNNNNPLFVNMAKVGPSIGDASSTGADNKRRTKNQRKNIIESVVADSRDDNSH